GTIGTRSSGPRPSRAASPPHLPCARRAFTTWKGATTWKEEPPPPALPGGINLAGQKSSIYLAAKAQFLKPTLHQVQPTGTGGNEVTDKPRMFLQPSLHARLLVCPVVVHDQMEGNLLGKLTVQPAQKLEPFLMTMPGMTLANDLAFQHIEGGKQRGRAIALVVVGHRATPAFLEGQSRLSPVQSLDLTLLIQTQHQRLLRRVEIQPDHVGQLLQKPRIAREFESPAQVRFVIVQLAQSVDGAGVDLLRV